MALLTLREVCFSTGNHLLLDHINLVIEPKERIALIGRNGAGKSTLMKLINREISVEGGELIYQTGLVVARLEQEVPLHITGTITDVVAEGLKGSSLEDWEIEYKMGIVLTQLELSPELDFASLSGGMKRRVLLARALAQEPDLLLLDEPTNHLDIESILWLEKFLLHFPAAILFITHDRALLQKIATRIIEIDRGNLTSFPGDHPTYLARKAEMLETEARHNALFDKRLAEEEVWIRQGIKARRTRNEGRVRALKKLREERSLRQNTLGSVSLKTSMAERSGQLVLEAISIGQSFGGQRLINDFSLTIERGDKIGIIGSNGCGKTTFLNILLGKLPPETGSVRLGQNLQIAYFDQLREQLNPNASVADNVMEGSTTIEINGEKKHIISYLQDFLFTPDRARAPLKVLSGGERNRLLLAKLFAKPANVLVMDEPTNDLDVETLDLLEELLIDYKGTLIVVSHDRAFLNNVVTSTIAFEGAGAVYEYVGGYDDWLRQRRTPVATASPSTQSATAAAPPSIPEKKKLSFKAQRELETVETHITTLEAEQEALKQSISDLSFYTLPIADQQKAFATLQAHETELELLIIRWEELSSEDNLKKLS